MKYLFILLLCAILMIACDTPQSTNRGTEITMHGNNDSITIDANGAITVKGSSIEVITDSVTFDSSKWKGINLDTTQIIVKP